jgi:hypothetical protein
VLFKSSKLLPVMFFRALLGNSGANTWADYGFAAALAIGLTLFSAGDASAAASAAEARWRGGACGGGVAPALRWRGAARRAWARVTHENPTKTHTR